MKARLAAFMADSTANVEKKVKRERIKEEKRDLESVGLMTPYGRGKKRPRTYDLTGDD